MQHYRIVNNKRKARGRKWLRPNLVYFSGICLDRLKEAMQCHTYDSRCPYVRNIKLSETCCLSVCHDRAVWPHIWFIDIPYDCCGEPSYFTNWEGTCAEWRLAKVVWIYQQTSRGSPLTKQPLWKNEGCLAYFGFPIVLQCQSIIKRRGTALITPTPISHRGFPPRRKACILRHWGTPLSNVANTYPSHKKHISICRGSP
jgi:hypothetical protein